MRQPPLHLLPLRIWHWLNAVIVLALLGTGLYLRLHGMAVIQPHDPVLLWHKGMGLAMIVTTLFWFIYAITGGNQIHHYGIRKGDHRHMAAQARYYLFHIFTGGENPFRSSAAAKYNPLQKVAYTAVMFLFLPAQAVTGLLFLNIPPLREQLLAGGLIGPLGAVHVLCYYLLLLYLIVHLYMASLGATVFSHTKAMITGYEEEDAGRGQEAGVAAGKGGRA
jgi:thiosulfate reductase cytochrome b subunit